MIAAEGTSTSSNRLLAARISGSVKIPLPNGATPTLTVFSGLIDGNADHFALLFSGKDKVIPTVRLHSSCMTGDILGSMRCDCGPQLEDAIEQLSHRGGCLLYLQQEGRGIGLANKIAAYQLQDQGLDTFAANRHLGFRDDMRDYRVAVQMLHALGIRQVRLLTNNPDKVAQLRQWGIEVVSVEPTTINTNQYNKRYLAAKRDFGGHFLPLGYPL